VETLSEQYKIVILCRALRVNRSTYYKHYQKKESNRSQENQRNRISILEIYIKAKKRFGAHKINQKLKSEYGIKISEGRVYRLMKGMELPKISRVKPQVGKKAVQNDGNLPNLLKKQFDVPKPNQIWVSDITYVKVGGKWHYICVVIDLFARKLIA